MTNNEKRNIYNAIQNLYNMDFTTWQEVLAMMYNLVADVEQKVEKLETKFTLLLGKEVTEVIKKMHESGERAEIINQEIFSDLNNKIDDIKVSILNTLNDEIARIDKELEKVLENQVDYSDCNRNKFNPNIAIINKQVSPTNGSIIDVTAEGTFYAREMINVKGHEKINCIKNDFTTMYSTYAFYDVNLIFKSIVTS